MFFRSTIVVSVSARRCFRLLTIGSLLVLACRLSWAVPGELYDPSEINRALWDGAAEAKHEMAVRLGLRDTRPGVVPVRYCAGNFTLEQNHLSLQAGTRHVIFAIYAHHDCNYDFLIILEPATEKLYRHVLTARFRNRPFHREISYPPVMAPDESMILVSGYTFTNGNSLCKETMLYRLEGWTLKLVFSGVEKRVAMEPPPQTENLDTRPQIGDRFFATKAPIAQAFKDKRMLATTVGRDGRLHITAEFEWNYDADHFLPVASSSK